MRMNRGEPRCGEWSRLREELAVGPMQFKNRQRWDPRVRTRTLDGRIGTHGRTRMEGERVDADSKPANLCDRWKAACWKRPLTTGCKQDVRLLSVKEAGRVQRAETKPWTSGLRPSGVPVCRRHRSLPPSELRTRAVYFERGCEGFAYPISQQTLQIYRLSV